MCRLEDCPLPAPLCPLMPSHQLTQPTRPRLPRRLTNSARINLNKYWHVLEELMPVSSTRRVFDESDSNAINENIDNERRLAAMQLSEVRGGKSDSSATTTLFDSGKTSASLSFPRVPTETSTLTTTSSSTSISFPGVPDSSCTAMSEDDQSSDENTPPSKSFTESSSR